MVFEDTRPSGQSSKIFTLLVVASLLVHFVLLHQFRWFKPEEKPKEQLIEVELLKPIKAIPPKTDTARGSSTIQRKSAPEKTIASSQKPKTSTPVTAQALPKKKAPAPVLPKPTLSVRSSLTNSQQTPIQKDDFTLTQKQLKVPDLSPQNIPVTSPKPQLPEPVSPLKTSPLTQQNTSTSATAKDVTVNSLVKKELEKEIQAPFEKTNPSTPEAKGEQEKDKQNTVFGDPKGVQLSGEIRARKLIYTPPAPQLNLDQDVKIRLEFTVLPNGEVDQVFPVQKANPELERIAIELLHQYRFEPLFESDLIQKGSIEVILKR